MSWRSLIGWGVDGYGNRHFACNHCELYFGRVDPDNIKHECDMSKPQGHNRGVFAEDLEREVRYARHIKQNKQAIMGIHYQETI